MSLQKTVQRCLKSISLVAMAVTMVFVFVGAVSSSSKAPDAARELLRFLRSPRALEVIKAQGMEPAP